MLKKTGKSSFLLNFLLESGRLVSVSVFSPCVLQIFLKVAEDSGVDAVELSGEVWDILSVVLAPPSLT